MLITVRLLKGFSQPLTYSVPENWETKALLGALVEVSLRKQKVAALVTEILAHGPEIYPYAIKPIIKIYTFPQDPFYYAFLKHASLYYSLEPLYWYKRLRLFLLYEEKKRDIEEEALFEKKIVSQKTVTLTEQQTIVVNTLYDLIESDEYKPVLLHGVTGSGKTEMYKKVIEYTVLYKKKTVMLLLPEVSLAVQFARILRTQLSLDIPMFSFHSATSTKEKRDLWACLIAQKPILIIGVHLPIMLPVFNLGAVIIDEEHETGFQEKKHPKINTKELALLRAAVCKIPIILGSATPSISSFYTAYKKNWTILKLHERFGGGFPEIKLVLLKDQQKRCNFWITKELEDAIKERLSKKEQIIIFLNRRGYSFFVQCKSCGFVFTCKSCSVSLTLHESGIILCHYCGYNQKDPTACSSCKADKDQLLKKGVGTQQIMAILEKMFPQARIARADLDTTTQKKKWQEIMKNFESGQLDILVGTQTITKGYHFPGVTLVGVIWADINLNIPFYNAAEQTLQQLIQVAGRAGRQSPTSLVIVQTMVEHPIFNYLNEQKYSAYYENEIKNREHAFYPPCARFAEIEIRHTVELSVDNDAYELLDIFMQYIERDTMAVRVLGPASPPVSKIKNVYVRKIYLKAPSVDALSYLWQAVRKEFKGKSSLFFTPNPLS